MARKRIRKKLKNLNQDQFSDAKETEVRCINGKDKILLNPIIEWSEQDVWEFLNKVVEVPHCELYDQGWTRIGCICCPMASVKATTRDEQRWPHVKEKWIKAIMEIRKESILNSTSPPNLGLDIQVLYYQRTLPPPEQGVLRDASDKRLGAISFTKNSRTGTIQERFAKFTSCVRRHSDSKFLDSNNGDCSADVVEYDEQKERMVAEAIYDWWRSKKSFNSWFAETYQQTKLDFDE